MKLKIFIVFGILFLTSPMIAQQDIVYDNMIYMPNIKSVTFSHRSLETSMPIIDIDTKYQGALELTFDNIEGGFTNYTYKIIHCDKDWYPSDIDEIEYLDGFNNEDIEDFAFSANGYSEYTNYNLRLPNDDVNWIISGNYLLVVTDDDLGVPIITRRFMVAERGVGINFELMKPRNVQKMTTHHEIGLGISYENMRISRPREELFVTVIQNGNWNSSLQNLQGAFVVGNMLKFNAYDQIIFPALKEYRSFDIRTLEYTTEFVNSIDRDDYETTVLIDLNKKRANRNFLHEVDANGYFILENADRRDGTVTSEYCNVIFNLQVDQEYPDDVYVTGAFSDYQAKEEFRMEYDPSRGLYLGQAQFKQGYYDYMFAVKTEDGQLDIDLVEGSFFETENDYHVLVYYRPFGALFDRLIGVTSFNSSPGN